MPKWIKELYILLLKCKGEYARADTFRMIRTYVKGKSWQLYHKDNINYEVKSITDIYTIQGFINMKIDLKN